MTDENLSKQVCKIFSLPLPYAERRTPMIYLPPPEGASGALRDWLERLVRELDRLEERVAELETEKPIQIEGFESERKKP